MIAYVLYVYMGMSQNEEEITEKKYPYQETCPYHIWWKMGGRDGRNGCLKIPEYSLKHM